MPFIDEFCLLHGYTLRYDRRSGLDVCDECERERLCPYCGIRPADNAGRSCTECDDMLVNCDPGSTY